MTNEDLNGIIDGVINESDDVIDIKSTAVNISRKVDLKGDFVRDIVRGFIEQKIRSRIAQIKGSDNIRDYFAVPIEGKRGVYANVPKSRDDDALERAASTLGDRIDGLKISHDKIMSRVHQIRHQIEMCDDGTLDLKTPDAEI